MSFYQELPYPVLVGSGSVLTSGSTQDLKPGQLALVDSETYDALSAGTNGAVQHPEVLIALGSYHTKDQLTKFIGGLKQSTKTQDFLGKDVIEFHVSHPQDLKQDIIQIGWDGVNDCDSLSFECGKSYRFKVSVSGEDVFRGFNRPLYRFLEFKTDCCPDGDCSDDCNDGVACKKHAKKLAELINNDPELQGFVRAEAVTSDFAAAVATHSLYCLNVCDTGDIVALAAVQGAYPTQNIERIARAGSISTYQFCDVAEADIADFTPTQTVLQAACGECPAGYTLSPASDVYIVRRPVVGGEDFTSDANKDTYADTVGTAYATSTSTTITDAQKIFLGQDGSVALVQIKVPAGTVVAALGADSVQFSHTEHATCVPEAATAIEWTACGDRYRTTRTLCITVGRDCAGEDRLDEIQAYYANTPDIVEGSLVVRTAGECADTYEIEQYNNACLEDGCLSEAVPEYDSIPSFESFAWEECPCEDEDAGDLDTLCGVRVTGAFVDTKFGDCSFEPTDYFSQRPVRINISSVNEDGSPCVTGNKVTKIQNGQVSTQSGEWLRRQYLKAASNEAYNVWTNDSRIREVFDQQILNFINKNIRYVVYYVVYTMNRDRANWATQHPADKYETIIAFPEGTDTSAFESVFGGYFAQFGVVLKERG